jgi:hypothetical protein
MDPSGKGVLSDVLEALSILLAAFFPPAATLGEVTALDATSFSLAEIAQFNFFASSSLKEGQGQQSPQSPFVIPRILVPPGYTMCSPVNAEATTVNPHQACGRAALAPNRQPNNGEVAIRPRDYGVDYPGTVAGDEAAQKTIKDADIRIYPDWGNATDAHNGRPAGQPNYGGPQGPMVALRAIDIISPRKVRDDPNRPTSIDIYRSNRPTDVKVPVIVVMKQSDKIHCPAK